MSRSILHELVVPSCKLVVVALAVGAIVAVVAGFLSNISHVLSAFLEFTLFEAAIMMIAGPGFLFRSKSTIESSGSKILLAGILLFILTMVTSLATQ